MANSVFTPYLVRCLEGTSPDLTDAATDIKITLVNTTTDYSFVATHEFFSSVTDYLNVTPQELNNANCTTTGGVFDCSDTITFSAVAIDTGKNVNAVVLFHDTGTPATSPLIAYYDTFTAITPDGSDIEISFDDLGIFSL